MKKTDNSHVSQPTNQVRRGLLRALGLTGAGALALPVLRVSAQTTTQSGGAENNHAVSGRKAIALLGPSPARSVDPEFVRKCDVLAPISPNIEPKTRLGNVLARMSYPDQIYLRNVKEAESWLQANGFLNSLDYFAKNGGKFLILFNELNSVTEPQYNIDLRTMAYLAYVLRQRYSGGSTDRLKILFPGPVEGLGPKSFFGYFKQYDLLSANRKPLKLGRVFGSNLDSHLKDRVMLHHDGEGVFDGVALRYDPTSKGRFSEGWEPTIPYQKWFRELVDDTYFLYQTECVDDGKSLAQTESIRWRDYSKGKALVPLSPVSSLYHIHMVAQA